MIKIDTVRKCDGCTKCCEGWLKGTVYGHEMTLGKPCYFKENKGCKIYEFRPNDPCKTFSCEWKNGSLPIDWKPNKIGIMAAKYLYQNKTFYAIIEAGSKHKDEVIQYYQNLYEQGKIDNFIYYKDGKEIIMSREFKTI